MAAPTAQTGRGPTGVDVELGRRIRELREQRGISQVTLAKMIGLTFQQIQKYEYGRNRVAVSRLLEIAKALDTPVAEFLPDDQGAGRG